MVLFYVLFMYLISLDCFSCYSSDRYPSTYPFENEVYKIDTDQLPERTPSFTYDATDPGGYVKPVFYLDPFINQYVNGPFAPTYYSIREPGYGVTFDDYACYTVYGVSVSAFPQSFWNCTMLALPPFEQSNFNGIFNGAVVCENCCSNLNYFGFPTLLGGDFDVRSEKYGTFAKVGSCGYPTEELYCELLDLWNYFCNEAYLTPLKRQGPIMPCFDSFIVWVLTCTFFRTVGILEYMSYLETPLYLDECTVLSQIYIYSVTSGNAIKGCLPYSYFNPGTYEVGNKLSSFNDFRKMVFLTVLLTLHSLF